MSSKSAGAHTPVAAANSLVDVSADTFERVFSELKAGGTRVLPILYNDESGQKTLLAKLRRLFASPSAQQRLISQMIQLAVDHDLDGWNLDFGGCNPVPLHLQPVAQLQPLR
jgi:hypothetical protein